MSRITAKIQQIQQAPEEVRLRYTLAAVALCMLLVVGLWLLSLKQALVGGVSQEAKQNVDAVTNTLSEQQKQKASLTNILKHNKSINEKDTSLTGEEFLQKKKKKERTSNVPNQAEE